MTLKTLELWHWVAAAVLVAIMALTSGCITLDDIRDMIPSKPMTPEPTEPTEPTEPGKGPDVVAVLVPGAHSQDTQITLPGYDGKRGNLMAGGKNAERSLGAARFVGDVITFAYALYGPVDAGRTYLMVDNVRHNIVDVTQGAL